jgi:aquaporin Z
MTASQALRAHWPEYAIEAVGLGLFLVSAVGFTVLLEHPASPANAALPDPFGRRVLMGLAMGATAITLVYSPFGQRSGAHFNPALTFTYWRLGKVEPLDAIFYAIAQFSGAALGVGVAALALGMLPADPAVRFAVTEPGDAGVAIAFAAEVVIAFGLMLVVLTVSNQPRVARFTGLCCGALVALYITFEAPLSGMSMNPARTLASAVHAQSFASLWLYFVAPLVGMGLAAECFVRLGRARTVHCAKLHHQNAHRCIFRCGWGMS